MPHTSRPAFAGFLLLGLYLTCHGYHSRDGDQAFRLPLLLDRQGPSVYAHDPFVRAFDVFNPHRGYLALLEAGSRVLGLSLALFTGYVLTFGLTCRGLTRMGDATGGGPPVGVVALVLFLLARAGNVGTNHLLEPELLDRLVGLALGWNALAVLVRQDEGAAWKVGPCIGLAAWVHPSLGLQLAALVGAGWVVLVAWNGDVGVGWRRGVLGLLVLAVSLMPAMTLQAGQGGALFRGMPVDEFVLLEAHVQSPQHLLPHLWRTPQWLAWSSYVVLAALALVRAGRPWPAARVRLAALLVLNLMGLAVAYVAVEIVREPRAILFQPFRMATVARGLALVAIGGRVADLARNHGAFGKTRAMLIAAGLTGDWTFVVVTAFEVVASVGPRWLAVGVLAYGIWFLSRHDTESGHRIVLLALVLSAAWVAWSRRHVWSWTPRRVRWAVAACWGLPLSAWIAGTAPPSPPGRLAEVRAWLVARCRFTEMPIDDVERLAVWCRENTPTTAKFVGPPQPKTFRLWSRRALMFNRSGTPYHAAGIADWARRFQEHVGFEGTTREFATAYLRDRQALERGYQRMTDEQRADLAVRQGAEFVIANAPERMTVSRSLVPLHVEGRYAVYRVVQATRLARQGEAH
jgi:hypothetical protein